MRSFLSIGLALLILLQSFSKVWIIISFKLNQDYIAQNLCVNRNKPEMHCCGKCVLNKNLKADEGGNGAQKKQLPSGVREQKELLYYFQAADSLVAASGLNLYAADAVFSYQPPVAATFVRGIFHPPNPDRV